MIFSSSHDHGPALSFFHTATITGLRYHFFFVFVFILPRSRASSIIFSSSHDHGSALSFFHTATITGQFYHLPKQPRTRACVIILYCHDHGPALSFLFFFFFFYIPPRSRARFPIFSCCLDHGPAYHFQAATITGLHYNVMYIYCLDHGKFRNRQ